MTNTKIYSETLKQNIIIGGKTGAVKCSDGVFYSANEVKLLRKVGGVSLDIHNVKKVIGGVICKVNR